MLELERQTNWSFKCQNLYMKIKLTPGKLFKYQSVYVAVLRAKSTKKLIKNRNAFH